MPRWRRSCSTAANCAGSASSSHQSSLLFGDGDGGAVVSAAPEPRGEPGRPVGPAAQVAWAASVSWAATAATAAPAGTAVPAETAARAAMAARAAPADCWVARRAPSVSAVSAAKAVSGVLVARGVTVAESAWATYKAEMQAAPVPTGSMEQTGPTGPTATWADRVCAQRAQSSESDTLDAD